MSPEMLVMTAPADHLAPPENLGWDEGEEPCDVCNGDGFIQVDVDHAPACYFCNGTGFPLSDPWGYEPDWPAVGY